MTLDPAEGALFKIRASAGECGPRVFGQVAPRLSVVLGVLARIGAEDPYFKIFWASGVRS